jgi:AcrR family transcriptional regulator
MSVKSTTPPKRAYRMRVRAEATRRTRQRILESALRFAAERYYDDVTLDAIAESAGVTVQTVLRHFPSKEVLAAAAAKLGTGIVEAQRGEAPVGDLRGAVRNLMDHYESGWGDLSLRLLAQEERVPPIGEITDHARGVHCDWVARLFKPMLATRRGRSRERLLAQLVAICDVYTWKILRRDRGLSREQTELALVEMVEGVAS